MKLSEWCAIRNFTVGREIRPMMYEPRTSEGAFFELRMAADPQAILPAVRNGVAQVDANLPLADMTTESEQIDRLLFRERLVAWLSGFFGYWHWRGSDHHPGRVSSYSLIKTSSWACETDCPRRYCPPPIRPRPIPMI
jgi:hypothetical protein